MLLRYPLGEFDYGSLSLARPEVAGIFFALYMALVYLVCINMVVAIITIAFEEVSSQATAEEKWKHAGRTMFAEVNATARLHWLLWKRCLLRSGCCGRGTAGGRRSGGAGCCGRGGGCCGDSRQPALSSGESRASSEGAQSRSAGGATPVNNPLRGDAGDGRSRSGPAGIPSAGGGGGDGGSPWFSESAELSLLASEAYYAEMTSVFIEVAEYASKQDLMRYAEEVHR
jgi:hypothetical protein